MRQIDKIFYEFNPDDRLPVVSPQGVIHSVTKLDILKAMLIEDRDSFDVLTNDRVVKDIIRVGDRIRGDRIHYIVDCYKTGKTYMDVDSIISCICQMKLEEVLG